MINIDENEILKDIEVNDELEKLKKEIEEKEEKYKYKRIDLINEKLNKIEVNKNELNKKLDELNNKLDNNVEYEEKYDWISQRKKVKNIKKEEIEMVKLTLIRRKEILIEKLIDNKLNLEKLGKKVKKIKKEKRIITYILDAIEEEKERRDLNNVNLLNKALKRGEFLENNENVLNEEEKILWAENLLNNKIDRKFSQKELLDKLFREKRQQNYIKKKELDIKIKKYNSLKFNLIKEEDEFLLKKAYFFEKVKDNPEADIPNFDLIKNNLNVNIDQYRNNYNKENILKIAHTSYKNGQNKIDDLKNELFEYNYRLNKKEKDKAELLNFFENCNKNHLEIAQYIIKIILSKFSAEIYNKEINFQTLLIENKDKEKRYKNFKEKIHNKVFEVAFNSIVNEFFDKKINNLLREISQESIFLAKKAYINLSNILYNSLKLSNKNNENIHEIKIISQNFKNPNLIKIKEKLIITFKQETIETYKNNNNLSFEEKIESLNNSKKYLKEEENSILDRDNCKIF